MSNSARPIRHLIEERQFRSQSMGIASRHDLKSQLSRQYPVFIVGTLLLLLAATSSAQDWIRTGTGLGVERVRLAASDFKPSTADPKNADLLKTFNDTLWNDLDNAGIFDLVSKSFYPAAGAGAALRGQHLSLEFPAAQRLHARIRQPGRSRR